MVGRIIDSGPGLEMSFKNIALLARLFLSTRGHPLHLEILLTPNARTAVIKVDYFRFFPIERSSVFPSSLSLSLVYSAVSPVVL